ncbi:MAG: hypothetical protein WCA11_09110, partial [Terracidiphilus sp.]
LRIVSLCALTMFGATALRAQTGVAKDAADPAPILGAWRAQMDGLPFITLTLTNENGSLQGAVLFYLHKREAVGQPWTSTPGSPGPIFNPKFDGETLTFQVSHRGAHPPRTLKDAPVTFRMKLTGANKAGLINVTEASLTGESDTGPGLEMVRSEF